jgi:NADH dehydrogenase FAD-containing subunit
VTRIDPATKQVYVGEQAIGYDYLVYALGSRVSVTGVPGLSQHALTLNPEDSYKLIQRLRSAATKHVVIVGGGLTGIEAASEIAARYPTHSVTLITQGQMGAGLSVGGRAYLQEVFNQLRIDYIERTSVNRLEADRVITNRGDFVSDVTLWAGSFEVSPIARESGIQTNAIGQVLVDQYLRSVSDDRIYAIGDAAATGLRMSCATAMPTGAYAADHLLARLRGESLPAFQFAYMVQCISLGRWKGLAQWVDQDDQPQLRVIMGWRGAVVKELISSYTLWAIQLERFLPGLYRYPRPKNYGRI